MTTIRVTGRDVSTGQGVSVVTSNRRIAAIEPVELTSGPWLAAGLVDLRSMASGVSTSTTAR